MIRHAGWEMRGELARLWKICFEEPARPAKYFLNNYFRPENALIYQVGEKIAAAVYLLPATVVSMDGPAQAHYIYAAATLPQYRSRGFMAALLAGAALAGAHRGDQYSVVLPATESLYPLYEKAGYAPFFRSRLVSVPAEKLRAAAAPGQPGITVIPGPELNALRNGFLAEQTGSVLWSDEAFAFAAGMGSVYGDRLVCSLTEGKPAYALCRKLDADTCLVLETMADETTFPGLAAKLTGAFSAQTYRFRLPVSGGLFRSEGEAVPFGMIRPVGGAAPDRIQPENGAPYLGLALD